VPAPREMAAAAMVGPQQMLLCGGRAAEAVCDDVALLDLQQMKWVAKGRLGGPLCAHTAVALQLPGAAAAGPVVCSRLGPALLVVHACMHIS
jgi:hypothetical protein